MSQESPKDEPKKGISVAELPVRLLFFVGETSIPFADLQQIGEGYLFELNADLTAPVRIEANGVPFASGELMAVGDKLGVRIHKLSNP